MQRRQEEYDDITSMDELHENLAMNCIPGAILSTIGQDYDCFLELRGKPMATKIRIYFQTD